MSRPLLVLGVLMGLTGCAPDAVAGTQRVELEGTVTAFAASGAPGRSYALDIPGEGLLPLATDERPPVGALGVVVEVPGELDIPEDVHGRFVALDALVQETGESLVVVDFLR